MGQFEDLVKQAREGDLSALDQLEQNFSGSTLREKAEKADSLESKIGDLTPLARKAKVDEVRSTLDEDLRAAVDYDDFADVDPTEITAELVQQKVNARVAQQTQRKQAVAKEAGFDTVEEYEQALADAKAAREKRTADLESVGGSVGGGGGEAGGVDSFTESKKAYDEAKQSGKSDDLALAGFLASSLERQIEEKLAE